MSRTTLSNSSFIIGSSLLVFTGSILLSVSTLFILNRPVQSYVIVLALAVCGVFLWVAISTYYRDKPKKDRIGIFAVLISFLSILFLASFMLSRRALDKSSDGYYAIAIEGLRNGWNPVYGTNCPSEIKEEKRIINYSKGPWLYGSSMYRLTGNIKTARVFNFLLMFAAFFVTLSFLLTLPRIKTSLAIIFAFLAASNPIIVTQLFSFYVDGQLAASLTVMFSLGLALLIKRKDALLLVAFCSSIIIAINVKLSAPAYVGVLLIFFAIYNLQIYRKEAYRSILAAAIALLLGVFIVGYSPYVTNTLKHHHPFYPVAGANAYSYEENEQMPKSLYGRNRFEKLFLSLFSKSHVFPEATRLKLPFTFSRGELNAFRYVDTRIGGFGPLFGGAFLLALAIMFLLVKESKSSRRPARAVLILLLSVIVNPEPWWFRFVPQMWLVPVASAVSAFNWADKSRLLNSLAYLLLLVLMIDVLLMIPISFLYYL